VRSKADISRPESTTRNQKLKSGKKLKGKTDMVKRIGKQSGESVESVLEKKMKATVGKICRTGRFLVWNERVLLRYIVKLARPKIDCQPV